MSDQVKNKAGPKDFPQSLEAYAPRAMAEFRAYSEFYRYWENSNKPIPNRVIPYAQLDDDFKRN